MTIVQTVLLPCEPHGPLIFPFTVECYACETPKATFASSHQPHASGRAYPSASGGASSTPGNAQPVAWLLFGLDLSPWCLRKGGGGGTLHLPTVPTNQLTRKANKQSSWGIRLAG